MPRKCLCIWSQFPCVSVAQELQDDLSQLMKLRQTTPEFQLSVYPPNGAQYVRHRDAFPDDGSDENQRKVSVRSRTSEKFKTACNSIAKWLFRTLQRPITHY